MVYEADSQSNRPLSSASRKERALKETTIGGTGKDTAQEQEGSVPVEKKKIGRYQIERVLGTGSMGAVYLAHDETLARPVAVKVPKFPEGSGDVVIQRFYREARSAAAITHPNICAIYDIGEDQGTHYIAMQYVEGHSLADYVESYRQPQEQVAIVVRKIALAMHEAHSYNLVHRDLKPDNVMIDHRGEPVVMDFGLARRSGNDDVRITREGTISGSPAYMSPEQLEGNVADVDPRSDIYSLGVLFYEALTGSLPFRGGGSIVALITEVISKKPKRPQEHRHELDPRICAICMRAMARKPSDRYATMQELAKALEKFIGEYRTAPMGQSQQAGHTADSPTIDLALESDQDVSNVPRSNVARAREDCKKVRLFLEKKEFQKAIDLLKVIADQKEFEIAKYAEWAARELPRVRSIVVANQEAALGAAVVPTLASLEEDVLWQGTPGDLSASAELRPRERHSTVVDIKERKRKKALVIGGVVAAILIVAAVLIMSSL